MWVRMLLLAVSASSLGACAVEACDFAARDPSHAPIETRRPVHGDNVRITSGFGQRRHPLLEVTRMHTGVDWAAEPGTPVIAAGAGRVSFAGAKGEYGNAVVIDHGGGWQTLYSQLLRIEVGEGDCVTHGAPIGQVGSTGLSAGPHLHFEVLRDGAHLDPMRVRISSVPDEVTDPK